MNAWMCVSTFKRCVFLCWSKRVISTIRANRLPIKQSNFQPITGVKQKSKLILDSLLYSPVIRLLVTLFSSQFTWRCWQPRCCFCVVFFTSFSLNLNVFCMNDSGQQLFKRTWTCQWSSDWKLIFFFILAFFLTSLTLILTEFHDACLLVSYSTSWLHRLLPTVVIAVLMNSIKQPNKNCCDRNMAGLYASTVWKNALLFQQRLPSLEELLIL